MIMKAKQEDMRACFLLKKLKGKEPIYIIVMHMAKERMKWDIIHYFLVAFIISFFLIPILALLCDRGKANYSTPIAAFLSLFR
jgi:hypothetical protein